jgi:hypothetical protein
MTVVPPTHLIFICSPKLRIKFKRRHFDTFEVMEAGSQAVLNTLIEHDFQDALNMAETLEIYELYISYLRGTPIC